MKKILITGGCGFVGHHVVEHFIKNTNWEIIVIDKLSYASNGFDRLRDINCFDQDRIKIFSTDLNLPVSEGIKREIGEVDYVLNLASESHVDNSISSPVNFIQNNVNLILNLFEWLRELKDLKRIIHFSTDEVYGTAPKQICYREGDRFNPGNPYSASKAAQESICRAYANTYQMPITITNCMNIIGERQHSEKFVPMIIRRIMQEQTVIIHADETKTKAGSRFYIHARNVAQAIHFILENTDEILNKENVAQGQYHIVGEKEFDNLEFAQLIASFVGKSLKYEMISFHASRPGHDLRYALDGSKMARLGWNPSVAIEDSLKKTVNWYLKYPAWLRQEKR